MNRKILISEDERSRILGLHENRKHQEWGLVFENFSKANPPFTDVKACKAEGRMGGIALAQKFGLDFRKLQTDYIAAKCNGKTPCDKSAAANINLTDEICEGTFGFGAAPSTTPTASSATGVTFAIDGKATVLNTDQEITDMVKTKKITANTLVFKAPEIPTWTKISALPEDSPIKKAVMGIIATVPPDLPGESKTFKISPDGRQPSKDYTEEQLTAAIKDGSLTQNAYVEVRDASGMATYQPIMQNADAAKIVNLASGPAAVQQNAFPNIATLDKATQDRVLKWGESQAGKYVIGMKTPEEKESALDNLDRRRGDKETRALRKVIRKAMGLRGDTWIDRGADAVTGAITGAQKGFG